jgi:hypothetical protein
MVGSVFLVSDLSGLLQENNITAMQVHRIFNEIFCMMVCFGNNKGKRIQISLDVTLLKYDE